MTLHEAMHAYASYWLGDDTARLMGRLSLNPIKHIDPVLTILMPVLLALSGLPIFGGAKPVPFNPQNLKFGEWGMAIVALAGPLTNLLIAFISFGLWVLVGSFYQSQLATQIFATMVSVNLGFFVFNMIPLPPLDGSRVLYVLAPEFVRRGMEFIERFGIIVVFAILLLSGSMIGYFMSGAINFFLDIFAHIFGI
ncbi:MAG: site-2 protease family protein [Candidatus Saccharibacteria bacterium]